MCHALNSSKIKASAFTFHSVGGPSISLALVPLYCRAKCRHSVPKSKSNSLHCGREESGRKAKQHQIHVFVFRKLGNYLLIYYG